MSLAGDRYNSMSDADLEHLARQRGYIPGGAGIFNRQYAIEFLRDKDSRSPPPAKNGNTSFSLSNLSSQSEHSSSERRKANTAEQARRTAMALMLRDRRSRAGTGATAAELAELKGPNNSNAGSENSDDDYDKLEFLEDEIGRPEDDDYNLCIEAQLLGLSENVKNGDDAVLGYLYTISEGDEVSENDELIVNRLLDRFVDEIIDDVKQASLSATDGSVNSEATDPSRILSEYSVTNVLQLLSKAVNEAEILDEIEGQNDAIEPYTAAAAAAATGRPPRARRAPQRFVDIVTQVLEKPRIRRPLPPPPSNSNSGSAGDASLNSQATCAREVLKATTKVRIESNAAPSQAKKIHGDYANAVNGDSLCSLCGFTLKERQPPDANELKWSYEHTIPVNLVALYFRIICSNNKYSAAEVEIMSQLGDVSCFNCNYTKSQARFISIPKVGSARPVPEAIGMFLENILQGQRKDGFTLDKKSTIKVAIEKIRIDGTYEQKKEHWKTIQTQNILKKVQNICHLMNTYVNIDQANQKLLTIKKYIRQCQAVANRNARFKSVAYKQIIASLSSHFPWKVEARRFFSDDRQSIKKRTYNFMFDTQKPGFYKGFDVLAKRLRMNTNEGPASSPSKRPAPSPRNNTRRRRLRRSKQRKSRKAKRHTRRRT